MNRIRPFLSRERNKEKLPLRDAKLLINIVKRFKEQRRRKKLIEIIRSCNKEGITKLPNKEILNVTYDVYPNYQKDYVSIINTYQVGGYQ